MNNIYMQIDKMNNNGWFWVLFVHQFIEIISFSSVDYCGNQLRNHSVIAGNRK